MSAVVDIFEKFVWQFVTLFSEMAPFLLLGFLLAGILHVWVPNHLYVPKIAKPNFKSVLWAALFGVPLPICSCGVIPTSIALRREGASKGASVSFLISTPATGVDSILATYSLLGGPFAILRPVAAFVTAMLGGVFTNFATRNEKDGTVDVNEVAETHEHHHEHEHCDEDHCGCSDEHCECCGCDGEDDYGKRSFAQKIAETFRYGLVNMVGDVSKWLTIGLLLGALIAAFVPDDFFLFLHEYSLLCMLVVLLLAMPMYTCATGSIPLALALVEKGITPGAALVLLMAGPATSIASMLVVGKAFGKRTLVAYLVSIALGAMAFGFVVDTFMMDTFLASMLPHVSDECHGHGAVGIFDYACAVLLAALMIYAKFAHKGCGGHCGCGDHGCFCCEDHDDDECGCHEHEHEHGESCHCHEHEHEHGESCHCHEHEHEHGHCDHDEPVSVTYRVNGMNCSHCKACVEKAVRMLDGVVFAEADVASKELRVQWHDEDDVNEDALKTAVDEAGFEFGGKI